MRKLYVLLFVAALAAAGCQKNKPAVTKLGVFTPYDTYPELLTGRVETVVEKNYWAIPDGNTFTKGNLITTSARDTFPWTPDFIAVFDNSGDIVSCDFLNSDTKSMYKNVLKKENNVLTSLDVIINDTAVIHMKFKCNPEGEITEVLSYRTPPDTLINRVTLWYSAKKDSVTRHYYDFRDNLISKRIYHFDAEGRFIMGESFNRDGIFTGSAEVKYNDRGRFSDLTFLDKDKNPSGSNSFSYEYDAAGNWIKAIVKDDKGNVVIEERTYTYFQ